MSAGTTVGEVSPRLVHSSAYEAGHQISTGPVTLFGLLVYNSNGGSQWIQLHDSATVPAEGSVPVITFVVAATANESLAATLQGFRFETGCYVCNSSDGSIKAIGAADCFFTASIH